MVRYAGAHHLHVYLFRCNFVLMKNTIIAIAACSALSWACTPGSHSSADAATEADTISSLEYVRAMGAGWNLGNQFDSYNNGVASETAWGNPAVGRELFDSIAAAGFGFVRIPVTWLGHVGPAPDYRIDSAWLERVAEVVGYAEQAGLKAIVNIHHDGADSQHWLNIKAAAADSAADAQVKARLGSMWAQIARRFADKGSFLVFEAANEIHDGGWGWGDNTRDNGRQYATHNGWMQTFVDSVRATGGCNTTRFLGIPGYCTNPRLTIDHLKLPADSVPDRLLVAVHFYDPVSFAINAEKTEWGHTADADKKESWGDEQNVTDVFDALKARFADRGTAVYIGEAGCGNRDSERAEAFRRYYMEYVWRAAAERGIAVAYWDNGYNTTGHEAFGLFDRNTGAFFSPAARAAAEAITRGTCPADSGRTLADVYADAPFADNNQSTNK